MSNICDTPLTYFYVVSCQLAARATTPAAQSVIYIQYIIKATVGYTCPITENHKNAALPQR